ncbi:Glycosyltransferase involved in cell wall bisynthesis [Mucilaginibacter sp. OK268]|jgi:glycosyltransferase involved in cell wall biosynthesis|uniref:glycosyltransferase family 2 protein n=1 Tax=Mucilaginibacter sp. OK268 TaxID=1881048 RepID=UPI0008836A10|nr:glycosyltransferase family 2 protein [Mucilaginibacter sp. OK268]SDQ00387.1 Glycosyltransferase involved in cell wall bisynthesis [Mucilaginibacter sp. OK268]
MLLPDLLQYRTELEKNGAAFPLQTVPFTKQGLLSILPKPKTDQTDWPWAEEVPPAQYDERAAWPKLTIVTPSFNQGHFLEETIRSVLLQNYPNLEFIVIDGGSTDSSHAILEKYSPWISYWQSKKDKGQSNAINLGFSLASGDYYAWINSDDYYLQNVFQLVINTFLKSQTDFVYGYAFNKKDSKLELVTVPPLYDYFIKIPSLPQPACFWSSGIHQPVWEEMYCALDYELWIRLVKGNKRKRIRQPLAVANVHDDAKTHDDAIKIKWHEDHLKMWSAEGHGPVPEWKRIVFLNRIRLKLYKLLKII